MTVAIAGMVAVIALLSVAVASLAVLFAARTQATTAADAAALAAAVATYPPASGTNPVVSARQIAHANRANLVNCRCSTDHSLDARVVEVVTYVDVKVPIFGTRRVHGAARAEFDPRRWLAR